MNTLFVGAQPTNTEIRSRALYRRKTREPMNENGSLTQMCRGYYTPDFITDVEFGCFKFVDEVYRSPGMVCQIIKGIDTAVSPPQ